LIIDDENIIAEAMKDTLEDVNYNVVLAADAQHVKIYLPCKFEVNLVWPNLCIF
jgi:DNA-binding NtrC family response regulator